MIGDNVVIMFTLNNDAKPPINEENITVTFKQSILLTRDHISVQMNGNVLLVNITSASLANEGVYTVTAKTTAGSAADRTLLSFYREKNGMFKKKA